MHLITLTPTAPLRVSPSHRSEMVSQLLFGEVCEWLENDGDFIKIRSLYDGYEGWCQAVQLHHIDYTVPQQIRLAGDWVNTITINGQPARIPFGSSLSFLQGGRAEVDNYYFEYNGFFTEPVKNSWDADKMREIAFSFLNTPYLWGGRSVFGIDCSGFTQLVFKCFNIYLHRDARQQATQGEGVGFLQESLPGDIAFFDNAEGTITHVGILLDAGTIIHASGKVRIDTIDHDGITNTDTGKRTHKMRILKRLA